MSLDWSLKEWGPDGLDEDNHHNPYPVFVDFYASHCAPCRMMEPLIEELAEEFREKVLFRKLNTDLFPVISSRFNVSGIPTFLLFRKGQEVWRNVGAVSKRRLREVLHNVALA